MRRSNRRDIHRPEKYWRVEILKSIAGGLRGDWAGEQSWNIVNDEGEGGQSYWEEGEREIEGIELGKPWG